MLTDAEQYLRFHNWPSYPMRQHKSLIRYRPRAIATWETRRDATHRVARASYPIYPFYEEVVVVPPVGP